jgi:DNA-binding IclR family transcriptional regulator
MLPALSLSINSYLNFSCSSLDDKDVTEIESMSRNAGMDDLSTGALAKHRIPVIDRMMDVLFLLEVRPSGATIRDLVKSLGQPRTTIYRMLNTLQFHGVVRRSPDGSYRLGPRLLTLAARAVPDTNEYDLGAIALPHLHRLSNETGEGCKISVVDGGQLLVLAASPGTRAYALTVIPGQRLPLHAGAAGKVLLAFSSKEEIATHLTAGLVRHTPRTITDLKRLRAELTRIRRQGWAHDLGEYAPSIRAFAAPIFDRSGKLIAALSVPYLAGSAAEHAEKIKTAVIATAAQIGSDIPAPRRLARAAPEST